MPTWPDPRSLSVGFAWGHNQYETPSGLTYEIVSPADDPDTGDDPGPVLDRVTITRGRMGNSPATTPASVDLVLRNTGGRFSPRNASGPYFGLLRQGVPCQVAIDVGTGALALARVAADAWNVTWDGPGINELVQVPGLGMLNRLSRDTTVRSAVFGSALFAGGNPTNTAAYWPMEDGVAGGSFASAVPAQAPLGLSGDVTFAADDSLPGSLPLPVFAGAAGVTGTVTGTFPAGGWAVHAYLKFAAAPTALAILLDVTATGGSAVRWVVTADTTTIYLTGYDSTGATVHSASSTTPYAACFSGDWVSARIVIHDSLGSFSFDVSPYDQTGAGGTVTGSAAVTGGSVTSVAVPPSEQLVGLAIGHIGVYATPGMPFTSSGPNSAATGYNGEEASSRVGRLLLELGVPPGIIPGVDSTPMGPQRAATAWALLREAEDADGGVLYDERGGAVGFQPIELRYNDAVAMTLAFGTETEAGDVSDLLPFEDGRDLFNIVTASSPGGLSATVEETDGPRGSDTTTGIGPRRVPISRNVQGVSELSRHAGWVVYRGTLDQPRYVLTLDLHATPDLAADWFLNVDIGSRIQITGGPSEHVGPDTLDLVVEGELLQLGATVGRVVAWCEPYEPFRVQQLADTPPADDDLDGWLIPDSMVLDSDFVAGTDTTMDVDVTPAISTDADEMPARLLVSGVLVEVTAVGAPSGSVQTLTVTQTPLNGVIKTVSAGTAVEFADPLVWSL